MVLDKALQPESSVKVMERYMLAAVEEPVTKIANQVSEEPEAAVMAVLFGPLLLELVTQEQRTSAAVAAAEATAMEPLAVQVALAS